MILRELLLLCTSFSLIFGINGTSYPSSGLERCMMILFKNGNIKNIGEMNPSFNKTELEYLCNHVDEFLNCFDKLDYGNDKDNPLKLRKILGSTLNFYCGDGKQLYLKSHVCLNKEPAKSQLKECMTKFHQMVLKEDPCPTLDFLSGCAKEAVGVCGEDATTFIQQYIKHATAPIFNCEKEETQVNPRLNPAIISILVVTAVIAIGGIAITIIVLKNRKTPNVPFERLPK